MLYNGLTGADFKVALDDIIEFVELGEFLNQPMTTYSQGMQARVQFAAATAIKPDILIIDEILGAGDAYFSAKSAVRMENLTKSGCTLLLVSHSMPQVLQFCERAVWIEKGRIMMEGSCREVVGTYEVASQRQVTKAVWSSPVKTVHEVKKNIPDTNIPRYAEKDWIAERIDPQMLMQRDQGVEAFSTVLESGKKVLRWPSEMGIKITDLRIDSDESSFITGGSMRITIKLRAEIESNFRCRYYISVFGLNGHRLAWITSPVDVFSLSLNASRHVNAELKPLLLGGGEYILSVSVFDDTDPREISVAKRFDLLARCIEFRVIEIDGRESPVFHHPADWKFNQIAKT